MRRWLQIRSLHSISRVSFSGPNGSHTLPFQVRPFLCLRDSRCSKSSALYSNPFSSAWFLITYIFAYFREKYEAGECGRPPSSKFYTLRW